MIFNLILHHIAGSALLLFGNIAQQLRRSEGLLLSFREDEIHWLHLNQSVNLCTTGYLFTHAFQRTNLIVTGLPVITRIRDGVILNHVCIHLRNHLLVLKLIQSEAIARLAGVIIL